MPQSSSLWLFLVAVHLPSSVKTAGAAQLQSPFFDSQGQWRPYRKLPNSDIPFTETASFLRPASGEPEFVQLLAQRCGETPGCIAFNSKGSLKNCAGCDIDPNCCIYPQGQPFAPADGVDLFVSNGRAPPADWVPGINDGSLLYAEPEPAHQGRVCYMPEVGNGYVASVIGFASTHVGGLFTGGCGRTHKARLPSPIAGLTVVHPRPDFVQGALDTKRGVYVRRFNFVEAGFVVQQSIYAHRTRRHVLVAEFELMSNRTDPATFNITLDTLFDANCSDRPAELPCRTEGNGCAGSWNNNDVVWNMQTLNAQHNVTIFGGHVASSTDDPANRVPNISWALPIAITPQAGGARNENVSEQSGLLSPLLLSTNSTLTLAAAVVTSLDQSPGDLQALSSVASQLLAEALGNATTLRAEHEVAWATLHTSGVEITPLTSAVIAQGELVNSRISASPVCPNPGGRMVKRPDGSEYPYFGLACDQSSDCGNCFVDHACLCSMNSSLHQYCCEPLEPPVPAPAPFPSPAPHAPTPFPSPTSFPLYHAWEIQRHYWSSIYFLMSSQRADWPKGGLSPGGLASQNYEGAVFMDQEVYMAAGLLLLQPSLALGAAQYRIDALPAAKTLSALFGYRGAMFPWTSAAGGYAFGCCDGNKNNEGFEDCIEQHITPDVSFALQQVFRATGDVSWLRSSAYPTLASVADWIVSRVSPKDDQGKYHIEGIMPIDEWCDQDTGCARPGISDDPQMNGACIAALKFAVEAAYLLGETPVPAWTDVANNLVLPFDADVGVHVMPSGPNGHCVVKEAVGFHDDSSKTSCPEDVNYLGFPWGPSLNISDEVVGNNMRYWSPGTRTCLENAGMTGPIHSIAWLKANPQNVSGAHFALNRSMLAAVYGPFNVRNEVDKHNLTVGGHFDNTHFLTGDGGFVQALVNGYAGLMLASQDGIKMSQPVLPEGVATIRVFGLQYLGFKFDISFDGISLSMNATDRNSSQAVVAPTQLVRSKQIVEDHLCIGWPYEAHITTTPPNTVILSPNSTVIPNVKFPAKLFPCRTSQPRVNLTAKS